MVLRQSCQTMWIEATDDNLWSVTRQQKMQMSANHLFEEIHYLSGLVVSRQRDNLAPRKLKKKPMSEKMEAKRDGRWNFFLRTNAISSRLPRPICDYRLLVRKQKSLNPFTCTCLSFLRRIFALEGFQLICPTDGQTAEYFHFIHDFRSWTVDVLPSKDGNWYGRTSLRSICKHFKTDFSTEKETTRRRKQRRTQCPVVSQFFLQMSLYGCLFNKSWLIETILSWYIWFRISLFNLGSSLFVSCFFSVSKLSVLENLSIPF